MSSLQTEVDQSELILVGAGPATGSINTGVSSIRTRPRALAPHLLDGKARAAGLLGERQRITDAKAFKRTKKRLGVRSIRDGFGRSGLWLWPPSRPSISRRNRRRRSPMSRSIGDPSHVNMAPSTERTNAFRAIPSPRSGSGVLAVLISPEHPEMCRRTNGGSL